MVIERKQFKEDRFYSSIKNLTRIINDDSLIESTCDTISSFFISCKGKFLDLYWNSSTNEFFDRGVPNETIFLTSIYKVDSEYLKSKLQEVIDGLLESKNNENELDSIYIDSGKVILEQFSEKTILKILSSNLTLATFFAEEELFEKEIVLETDIVSGKNIFYLFKICDEKIYINKNILSCFSNKKDFILNFYKEIFSSVYNERYS